MPAKSPFDTSMHTYGTRDNPLTPEHARHNLDLVIAAIETDRGNHFDMSTFMSKPWEPWAGTPKISIGESLSQEPENGCGTTLCIAGWAFALANFDEQLSNISDSEICAEAEILLGLTENESTSIFYATEMEHDEALEMLKNFRELANIQTEQLTTTTDQGITMSDSIHDRLAATRQSWVSFSSNREEMTIVPVNPDGQSALEYIEELESTVRSCWAALNFILAFYEPGQRHLDTNAWTQAEASGRRAHKQAGELMDKMKKEPLP